ncbi:DUF3152 domain-containing protein [Streptomyces sp. NPDC047081]|uniref:DUF3152 domain-containing protein n=1 Tax=Streptomyces sp. NPDC047081 TaxID=3154706 RepID=UPI0033F14279
MGRHSRRGGAAAAKGDAGDIDGGKGARGTEGSGRSVRPGGSEAPRTADGTPARGVPRLPDGTPARGVPRTADGTPARGVPRTADGTPARGMPRFPDGTPAHGVPRLPDGTPAHGVPRYADGTPARGVPQVRGGHPEQREGGGGWGQLRGRPGAGYGPAGGSGAAIPRQRQTPPGGPRQDYLDAFGDGDGEDVDVFAPRGGASASHASDAYLSTHAATSTHPSDPYASVTDWDPRTGVGVASDAEGDGDDPPPSGVPAQAKGAKGRTFTGIAAAAVTTVLAVVVAGQVTHGRDDSAIGTQSATDQARDVRDSSSRGEGRPTPSSSASVATLTYAQKMDTKYTLSATLKGSGKFDAIPGTDKAPGKGQKYTYRVDVERGLGLDGALFAQAVQKTLNDDRSWAHDGARTFERVSTGKPDFVITLASPGTTATWCAKSGLDTTEDNVSCDSASTQRVMINAYRWAQGSTTYGDQIHAYRQMLINHEVGHRLGYSHVTCSKDGQLAPVMQQQTKFLDHDGIHCLPNPWPYPRS